jgi:hypothetical protein
VLWQSASDCVTAVGEKLFAPSRLHQRIAQAIDILSSRCVTRTNESASTGSTDHAHAADLAEGLAVDDHTADFHGQCTLPSVNDALTGVGNS